MPHNATREAARQHPSLLLHISQTGTWQLAVALQQAGESLAHQLASVRVRVGSGRREKEREREGEGERERLLSRKSFQLCVSTPFFKSSEISNSHTRNASSTLPKRSKTKPRSTVSLKPETSHKLYSPARKFEPPPMLGKLGAACRNGYLVATGSLLFALSLRFGLQVSGFGAFGFPLTPSVLSLVFCPFQTCLHPEGGKASAL